MAHTGKSAGLTMTALKKLKPNLKPVCMVAASAETHLQVPKENPENLHTIMRMLSSPIVQHADHNKATCNTEYNMQKLGSQREPTQANDYHT